MERWGQVQEIFRADYCDKEPTSRKWFMGKDDKFGLGHVELEVPRKYPNVIPRRELDYMGLELTELYLKFISYYTNS